MSCNGTMGSILRDTISPLRWRGPACVLERPFSGTYLFLHTDCTRSHRRHKITCPLSPLQGDLVDTSLRVARLELGLGTGLA